MLKVHTNRSYLPSDGCAHIQFLFPIWGDLTDSVHVDDGLYDFYRAIFPKHFTITETFEGADFAVLPADLKHYRRLKRWDIVERAMKECQAHGLKLVTFFKDDSDEAVALEEHSAVVFRTSLYRSTQRRNEFAMPVWSGDLTRAHSAGAAVYGPSAAFPSIGFCGQTLRDRNPLRLFVESMLFRRALAQVIKGHSSVGEFGRRWHPYLRHHALRRLARNQRFRCRFVTHREYYGGAWLDKGQFDQAAYRRVRKEFIDNLYENDAFPCIRGRGNYSLRLYEVLCCGKIPIHLDTESVLPFEDVIPWNEHLISVDVRHLPELNQRVSRRLAHCSRDNLIVWQAKNRRLWEQYLSPEGFFVNFPRYLG